MNIAVPPVEVQHSRSGWRGYLGMRFSDRDGRTQLSHRVHSGPLSVQRPFRPEQGGMQVYILHPPGGVVGGDILDVDVDVASRAEVLLTTPGATKLYRSGGDTAQINNSLTVTGKLEWMPQENIFFNGAHVHQRTHVRLTQGAGFIGWEVHCLGRIASGERFSRGNLDLGFNLTRDEFPLLVERLRIRDDNHRSESLFRGFPVCASMYATAADGALVDLVRKLECRESNRFCGMTLLDDLLVIRYLGNSVADAWDRLRAAWRLVRPAVIGRESTPPRIWST
mgnify:CR=1 FL=1